MILGIFRNKLISTQQDLNCMQHLLQWKLNKGSVDKIFNSYIYDTFDCYTTTKTAIFLNLFEITQTDNTMAKILPVADILLNSNHQKSNQPPENTRTSMHTALSKVFENVKSSKHRLTWLIRRIIQITCWTF